MCPSTRSLSSPFFRNHLTLLDIVPAALVQIRSRKSGLPTSPPPPPPVPTMGFAEATRALLDAYLPRELHIPAYFCGFNILWTFVAAEVTGNASQVDRVSLSLLLPCFMY